jgi:hypothetical protein
MQTCIYEQFYTFKYTQNIYLKLGTQRYIHLKL